MAEHPLEAFAIARRALEKLGNRPDLRKRLLTAGARLQDERLSLLNEEQVSELASVYAAGLDERRAAKRVRQDWLKIRERSLGPADGPGRVHLARLYFHWLDDRAAAARLCQEALRVRPEEAAAVRFLQDELGYQKTDSGWLPRNKVQLSDRRRNIERIHPGMTAAEVQTLLGRPDRTPRQILYRRFREQWIYDDFPGLRIEFDCIKGQDPRVIAVHLPP
jgi:hypothetical protein